MSGRDLHPAVTGLAALSRLVGGVLPDTLRGEAVTLDGPDGPIDATIDWMRYGRDPGTNDGAFTTQLRLAGDPRRIAVHVSEASLHAECFADGMRDPSLDWLTMVFTDAVSEEGDLPVGLMQLVYASWELAHLHDAVKALTEIGARADNLVARLAGTDRRGATIAGLAPDWDGDLGGLLDAAEALAAGEDADRG